MTFQNQENDVGRPCQYCLNKKKGPGARAPGPFSIADLERECLHHSAHATHTTHTVIMTTRHWGVCLRFREVRHHHLGGEHET